MEIGNIVIYACGGCGINISSWFEQYRSKAPNIGFASINPVYIDTSKSNITKTLNTDHTYTIEGLDGSGKVRRENAQIISQHVRDILNKFKPGDLSIVVSSMSGGSGSVIAPSIVSELLERGQPVVVCSVSSTDSRIEIENTITTLKSYESIANMRATPVNMIYRENSLAVKRSEVDKQIQGEIAKLAALFSRQNKEMDSSDLVNWLNFTKVTSYPPKLTFMDFYSDKVMDLKYGSVVSVATLAKKEHNTFTGQTVEYQCVGYPEEENSKDLDLKQALHYVLLEGVFDQIFKDLSKSLKELDDLKNARINKQGILSNNDKPADNGLVF